MPSALHEALVLLFRSRPALAIELLRERFGVLVPEHDRLGLASETMRRLRPVEVSADAVVVLEARLPVLGVVVEVQLGRDDDKQASWPSYVVLLRRELGCPVVLFVVAVDEDVARWCAQPIETGHPGFTLRPLVLGPSIVPRITDQDRALEDVELAVLSALAHGCPRDDLDVVEPALRAIVRSDALDDARRRVYLDLVLAALSAAARTALEARMKGYEYQSDFAKKYVAEGRAEGREEGRAQGEAHALLTVLAARGFVVDAELETRVRGCTDLRQLDRWIARAAVARSLDAVFEDG